MIRIPYFTLVLLLTVFTSCEEDQNTEAGHQRKISFNRAWEFRLGDSLKLSKGQWRGLDLPHDWSIEGNFSENHPAGVGGGALPGGLGWYKKKFTIAPEDSTKIISIHFDGVYMNSEVWINGEYLGKRPNGYIGFQYELSPYLNYGEEENEILVKVDNSQQPNSRWYSGSGIYRNVWLLKTNKLHIPKWGTFITTPNATKDSARVIIEVDIQNKHQEAKKALIETSFFYEDNEVGSVSEVLDIAPEGEEKLIQQTTIVQPYLWSTTEPHLYKAITRIKLEEETLDEYETIFGIRTFSFDVNKGFILNGEQTKIKGVCLHHDLGPLGAAVNTRAIERQLEIMQEMGANGIRTAHNPPAPELLDLCDQMGFIVMDEAFDIWETSKTEHDYSKDWEDWHEQDLSDILLRDRNHPSIFMWSIGNEIPEQWSEKGAEIAHELAGITRAIDSTRPITAGMNPPNSNNKLATSGALDIIGYNYAHDTYEDHLEMFPGMPFIATETTSALATRGFYEFPSDTTKIWPVSWDQVFTGGNPDNTVSAFDQVRTPWGSTHEDSWKVIKNNDFLSGFFIWTGFDYIGEPTPYIWPSRSSYFGIADLAGFPKDSYYMYQSEWTDKPVLHLFPHWNWEEGQIVDVWAYYNNADEVELFLNGESQGIRTKKDDDLHVMWRLPFKEGYLKAVSRKNAEVVLEQEIHTAGSPAAIILQPDRPVISANGEDLSFVTVTITDENENLAPRADNLIHFELKGGGEIAGVASGDPTSHESFKGSSHKALNGKVLVIIKSSKDPASVELTATAEGLRTAKAIIDFE